MTALVLSALATGFFLGVLAGIALCVRITRAPSTYAPITRAFVAAGSNSPPQHAKPAAPPNPPRAHRA